MRRMSLDPPGDTDLPAIGDWRMVPFTVGVVLVFVERGPEPGRIERVVAGDKVPEPQLFPFRRKDLAAVKGKLEAPRLHDHLEPDPEALGGTDDIVDDAEVVEIEPIELRRLLAAAPRPRTPGLPVAVSLLGMERADRKANANEVEPLARPPLEERRHIETAVGHSEEVVCRVAKQENGLTVLMTEAPPLPGRRAEETARLASGDFERSFAHQPGVMRHRRGAILPAADRARVEPDAPGPVAVMEGRGAELVTIRADERRGHDDICERAGIGDVRCQCPFADRTARDMSRVFREHRHEHPPHGTNIDPAEYGIAAGPMIGSGSCVSR